MTGRLRHQLRHLAPCLMALALLARLIVPAGFMPMQGADGVTRIMMCSGAGPMTMPMPAMMMGSAHHGSDSKGGAHEGDHACPFAGFAMAAHVADMAGALPPLFAVAAVAPGLIVAMRPGLGLAAPPPPKTGPPLILR
jgi:hypothetical protein